MLFYLTLQQCLNTAYVSSFDHEFQDTATADTEGKRHLKPLHQEPLGRLVYDTKGHDSTCLKHVKMKADIHHTVHVLCQIWASAKRSD